MLMKLMTLILATVLLGSLCLINYSVAAYNNQSLDLLHFNGNKAVSTNKYQSKLLYDPTR